ncbi:hypothetical protein ACIBCN_19015 [Nocardia sp. NPDC051052]|uniref:hypothetical protein n=1 Tax=Nocardia sp. NPDC051052 TaxID=3364322 RepID=UPI00379BC21B
MPEPNHQLREARTRTRSHTTGHELQRPELADLVNAWIYRDNGNVVELSGNYIGKLERGVHRWPSEHVRAGLRAVLGAVTDAELGFRPVRRTTSLTSMGPETDSPTLLQSAGKEVDDVLRRTFLLSATAAGVGTMLGLESARHGLNRAVTDGASADLADWYEVVREYGDVHVAYTSTELRELLLVDILNLQMALSLSTDPGHRRELYKVGALLSHYMAQAVGDIGQRRDATRWWRTAHMTADSSRDMHIMMYIRGRKAIRAIYDGQPPQVIIDEISKSDELIKQGPVIGRPSLVAARAQTMALMGRADEAESSLIELRDTFSALPSDMTGDHSWHCWAYPEERLRFAESFVYSHLGDVRSAEKAQQAALALYPPSSLRGPIQIHLQHALCLVRSGDHDDGASRATETLASLPSDYRTRFVMGLGEQVLAAVPRDHRHHPAVKDLHEVLRDDAEHSRKAIEA